MVERIHLPTQSQRGNQRLKALPAARHTMQTQQRLRAIILRSRIVQRDRARFEFVFLKHQTLSSSVNSLLFPERQASCISTAATACLGISTTRLAPLTLTG